MRPQDIVVLTPGSNDDLRFATATKPLEAQALVTQSSVEGLVHAVLPRFVGIDQRSLDVVVIEPLENRFAALLFLERSAESLGDNSSLHQASFASSALAWLSKSSDRRLRKVCRFFSFQRSAGNSAACGHCSKVQSGCARARPFRN